MIRLRSAVCVSAWVALALFAGQSYGDPIIQFNYTYDTNNFFGNATAKATLEQAGAFFQNTLSDNLTAIVPSGTNTWTAAFNNPSTGGLVQLTDVTIPSNTIVIYVGARNLGGALGLGGPGGYSAGGTTQWLDTVGSRGQGVTSGAGAVDFGPWGGTITFTNSSSTAWNFSASTGPNGNQSDFLSVALHEIGHVLGFGTADSFTNRISGSNFTGAASQALYGGPVPLAPAPDLAHWQQGLLSKVYPGGASQEVAMDPAITVGTRKVFTDLDVAGMNDIGWQIKPVPEPSQVVALVGMALVGVVVCLRRKT